LVGGKEGTNMIQADYCLQGAIHVARIANIIKTCYWSFIDA
jgi:hypothetical protein